MADTTNNEKPVIPDNKTGASTTTSGPTDAPKAPEPKVEETKPAAPAPEDKPVEEPVVESKASTEKAGKPDWVLVRIIAGKHSYQDEDTSEWKIAKVGDDPFKLKRTVYDVMKSRFELA